MVELIEHIHILGGPVTRAFGENKSVFMLDVSDRKYYTLFQYGMLPTKTDRANLLRAVNRDISARGEELAGMDEVDSIDNLLIAYNELLARHLLESIGDGNDYDSTITPLPDGRVMYEVTTGTFSVSGMAPHDQVSQRINERIGEAIRVARQYVA